MIATINEGSLAATPVADACWNRIGVRGDRSCPTLAQHVHCRNCAVYSAAALSLLDGELSDAIVAEHTDHFAAPTSADVAGAEPVMVFRVGSEWLALPMEFVAEIAENRPIRTLPHRRGGLVLGVANVRGELVGCVSLAQLLGLDRGAKSTDGPSAGRHDDSHRALPRRLLVLRSDDLRVVAPVDEVSGIERFSQRDMTEVPTIVARAATAHARAVVHWSGRSLGLVDGARLMRTLRGSLS
jgi:chemotaxis-related protein WspD